MPLIFLTIAFGRMSEEPATHGSTPITVINYLSYANYLLLSELVINIFLFVCFFNFISLHTLNFPPGNTGLSLSWFS